MATHSSILSWRIPGTEEPSGLLSMGSHRVRHDWSNLAAAAAGIVLSTFLALSYPVLQQSFVIKICIVPKHNEWAKGGSKLPSNLLLVSAREPEFKPCPSDFWTLHSFIFLPPPLKLQNCSTHRVSLTLRRSLLQTSSNTSSSLLPSFRQREMSLFSQH